jgi:RNA polymerase sigma-70 factor (subfamily 1)
MESWERAQALVLAAKGGERQAFDELAREYLSLTATYVRKRLGFSLRRRVEADDLVQETFLRAYRSIGQFRGETAPEFWNWVCTIADHVIQDQGRRLKARKGALAAEVSLEQCRARGEAGSWALESPLQAAGGSPSRVMRREERFERLKRVLRTLKPDHARVIFLARVQGLPIKEVARRMSRSQEATSMLLLRALLKLKAAFGATDSFHLPERSIEDEREKSGE